MLIKSTDRNFLYLIETKNISDDRKEKNMENPKISTNDTKKMTGLSNSGIRKLRKIFQDKQRIGPYEQFDAEMVEELKEIVAYQRLNPHSSYDVAYDAVQMKNALDRLKTEAVDDFTNEAVLAMGEGKFELFSKFFSLIEDFLIEFDDESVELLKNLESVILARIILKTQKNKKTAALADVRAQ